jgi:hypothetical protein
MAGIFENVHLCDPLTSVGLGEQADWRWLWLALGSRALSPVEDGLSRMYRNLV